jgi:hypothetical protein
MRTPDFGFRISVLAAALAALPASARAQGVEYVREHYAKREVEIPMRDGKKLFTSVYEPKDASKRFPILLNRTPYTVAPYGPDKIRESLGPSPLFARDGYVFVYQDVRGRYMSEGEFVPMTPHRAAKAGPADIDESTDTYDTIEWLLKNVPGHNGKVGQWGISYPGFYTAAGMIDAHPALAAASPQAPVVDWFAGDDWHHNGAFYLPHAYGWLSRHGHAREKPGPPLPVPNVRLPDGYSFYLELGPLSNANERYLKGKIPFWNDIMAHGTYDAFWKARNLRPHLRNIRPAVMTVGGWFDAENLFGALECYKAVERQSPGASNVLVMGPWWHGQWARDDGEALGFVRFGSKTGPWYRERVEFPFFSHHLKGREDPKLAEATVFLTGKNEWRMFDAWPPPGLAKRPVYFRADGRLSFDPPQEESDRAFDEYVSDPARPVPYIAGQAAGMTREHMVDDQRFAAARPDVLVYRSEPLAEDLTVAGPVAPSLHVSTTGTDSDWVVKLIDVYPPDFAEAEPRAKDLMMGGYQQLLRGECMRGKFRRSLEAPEPFVPGKVEPVEYVMPDVFHTFRKGHRIMVQVQSSWFPLVDRNPQKFCDIYSARAEDFQKATQRVHRSKGAPSSVVLNVLP